jgi:hypothetical protein
MAMNQHMRLRTGLPFAVLGCLLGCEAPADLALDELVGTEMEVLAASAAATAAHRVQITGAAISYDWAKVPYNPINVDGDAKYVFATQALAGRIAVLDRFTGAEVSTLPAPADGFVLPTGLRVSGPGQLSVLDSGGLPLDFAHARVNPRVYTYEYQTTNGAFSATLVRDVRFQGSFFGFAENLEVIGPDRLVIPDQVIGSLWIIEPDGSIVPGIVPTSDAPEDALVELAGCQFPEGFFFDIEGIPFIVGGRLAPGAAHLAFRGGYLYFPNACRGHINRVPTSVFDDGRAPHERAASIETISSRPVGEEILAGMTFNEYDPSDGHLYFTMPTGLKVMRLDLATDTREVVGDDPTLFNFPVTVQFLPPVLGVTPLLIGSDQEHRILGVNELITEDLQDPPFTIAKAFVLP